MTFEIPHISQIRRGNNQYKKRILGLREDTWKSISILGLIPLTILFLAVNDSFAVKQVKLLSPIPDDAYIMAEITPKPTIITKIIYVNTPKEVKEEIRKITPPDQWNSLSHIINGESGFKPTTVNSIGACGLGQALPCSKMKCELTDVTCQLDWMNNYIKNRYGNVDTAWKSWQDHVYQAPYFSHWY